MARYTGSACKLCRSEQEKLFLKGQRCNVKCALDTKRGKNPPGKKAGSRMRKASEYAVRLREKQKAKRLYGLTEQQFSNFFVRAAKLDGLTGDNLLQLLELRLDNVVYRLGMAPSRRFARQIVNHGHVLVNGKRVSLPGYPLKQNDTIALSEKMKISESLKRSMEQTGKTPAWLKLDATTASGAVLSVPRPDECSHPINSQLIVELYSK